MRDVAGIVPPCDSVYRRTFRSAAGPSVAETGDARGIARMARSYEAAAQAVVSRDRAKHLEQAPSD